MKKLKALLYVIGSAQIILGLMALVFPAFFIEGAMHLTAIPPDMGYPLGMFASRLLVFGLAMFIAALNPEQNRMLIDGMILIQCLDLLVGCFYILNGQVAFSAAALPMFDAGLFMLLLTLWRPQKQNTSFN